MFHLAAPMPGDAPNIRVMVLEDDPDCRATLVALLDGTPGFCCCGAHRLAITALERIPLEHPQVVLVDLNLPGMSGVDFLRKSRRQYPEVELLVLTVLDGAESVFPALAAGASGYLMKGTPATKIFEAIREVLGGGASMSGPIARLVLRSFHRVPRQPPPPEDLSPREVEVLQLLAEGLRYDEIAQRLFLSVRTVNSHLQHIYRKLHVHSAVAAVAKFHGGRTEP